MCGRFVAASPPDELARYFGAEQVAEPTLEASYNVAPTNDAYVVLERGGLRRLDTLHWGLVPFWAKDPSTGNKMINARAEGLADKAAYKRAFAKRRCLVPVDGFYEWKKVPSRKAKQPLYICRADGEPLALAGLWELWRPKGADGSDADETDGEVLRSFTIITGEPNDKLRAVHDRMPVILPPSAWDAWLDPGNDDLEALGRLLVPAPSELLVVHPVSTAVNNVRENGPELIEPADVQGQLIEG